MIHEYALEPTVLDNVADLRYFLENFGVHTGRLIADYPKRWERLVFKIAAQNLKPIERKRFSAKLEQLTHLLLEPNERRSFDGTKSWLENAELVQKSAEPFKAIIARENPRNDTDVLVADDLTPETELWKVPRQTKIPRTVNAIVQAAAPLLQISRQILFVEPYFDPCAAANQNVLRGMLRSAQNRTGEIHRIEIHCTQHSKSGVRFWEDCESDLPSYIPAEWEIEVFRWQVAEGTDRFHRRYVLTERGGIAFEGGLDSGRQGQTTDIFLLEESLRKKRWADYQRESNVYQLDADGPKTIKGTMR